MARLLGAEAPSSFVPAHFAEITGVLLCQVGAPVAKRNAIALRIATPSRGGDHDISVRKRGRVGDRTMAELCDFREFGLTKLAARLLMQDAGGVHESSRCFWARA